MYEHIEGNLILDSIRGVKDDFLEDGTLKTLRCSPSIDEWIKKWWYICTVEYYLATKKNEILVFVTAWLDLQGIMLSEISQRKTNII